MKNKKYVATLWINEYDYDGLTCHFEVLGIFADVRHGQHAVTSAAEASREVWLKNHESWHDMDITGLERPVFGDINAKHNVVASSAFKIGDGSGFESAYQYFDLIEVDIHEPVDATVFSWTSQYAFEIKGFFDSWNDKMIELFSVEEALAWLKRNPGKTPPQGWEKFNAQLEALGGKPE